MQNRNVWRWNGSRTLNGLILTDIRQRDRLVKQRNRRSDYKKLRNEIVSKIRKAERSYIKKQVEESVGDIKKHWDVLKKVINKTNNKEDITTEFLYEGSWVRDNQQNVINMSNYLSNIGRLTNETVGPTNTSAYHLLQKNIARNEHTLLLSEVDAEDVYEVCKNMTPKTSSDPHGFKQNVILSDADIISHVISHLVNCSMKAGKCPHTYQLIGSYFRF